METRCCIMYNATLFFQGCQQLDAKMAGNSKFLYLFFRDLTIQGKGKKIRKGNFCHWDWLGMTRMTPKQKKEAAVFYQGNLLHDADA